MAILTGFLVSPRKGKKSFWKKVGLVETFRTAKGRTIHKVPHFNLRVEENAGTDDAGRHYHDVFNVIEKDGKIEKNQIARAFPLRDSRHGFRIPSLNYTAIVPTTTR